jgi:tRNA-binding protein
MLAPSQARLCFFWWRSSVIFALCDFAFSVRNAHDLHRRFSQSRAQGCHGKISRAHPNADKLIVLQVDLGSEQRQICAGIRNHYTPEELVGKQVVVVANLETAKLRGLESQGMLLAASDDGRVIILTPEKPVLAGAQVK